MSEHQWLLKENVENAPTGHVSDGGHWSWALKRGFVADWLEMRKLLRRAYMQLDLPISDEVSADLADEILEAWSAMEG